MKRNERKGITLIALIITVIVLLILAGTAISIAINGGNIFGIATAAKEGWNNKVSHENSIIGNYISYFDQSGNNGPVVIVNDTPVTLTQNNVSDYIGREVINFKNITENTVGDVTSVTRLGSTTPIKLASSETGSAYETENITIGNSTIKVSTTYRLFYVDFNNKYGDGAGTIYLKADPTNESFGGIGGEDPTKETVKLVQLNPALYNTEGVSAPPNNQRSILASAWLLDTEKWNSIATNGINPSIADRINYAVGAPTLEMFIDSYNEKYGLADKEPDYGERDENSVRTKLEYSYGNNSKGGYTVGPLTGHNAPDAVSTTAYTIKPDNSIGWLYSSYSIFSSRRTRLLVSFSRYTFRHGILFILCWWHSVYDVWYWNADNIWKVRHIIGEYHNGYAYTQAGCICPVISLKPDNQLILDEFDCPHPNFENGNCTECGASCTSIGGHKFINSDSICKICNTTCTHNWNDEGRCRSCGKNCEHPNWVNSRCTICNCECRHYWNDGVCETCGKVCTHDWNKWGECVICDVYCEHPDWSNGICTTCGYGCDHNWIDGTCDICGKECTHNWNNYGECTICDVYCEHPNWSNGTCTTCGYKCEHEYWDNGVCETCGKICTHDWDDWGECNICYMYCEHPNWSNGFCTTCGCECDHYWSNGVCDTCGLVCHHVYEPDESYGSSGSCSICGFECEHPSWQNGVCQVCGHFCTHNWNNGVCEYCGVACTHDWHGGYCYNCYMYCEHPSWTYGYCDVCGYECYHEYENGVCIICGETEN